MAALDNQMGLSAPYRSLWPLLALLTVEGLALGLAAATTPLQGTRFSVAVAVCVLLTGLLPALLRPSAESALAACLATLMVSLLAVPFDRTMLPQAMPGILLTSLPWFLVVRLANGATLAPLSFHLAARFPQRAAGASHQALSNRTVAWCYGLTWTLVVALLLAPTAWSRLGAFVLLVGWLIGLFGAAFGQLIATSRDPAPENQRAAQQAGLLLFSIAMAATPWAARAFSLMLGVGPVPYNLVLLAQIFVPLGVAYTVLRHDLFGIDDALRRALAYATLSLVLLALYFGLTVAFTALLARTWPQFRALATLIGLFAAAAAFEPLRRRIQSLIDRALYPQRLNFRRELAAARAALARVVRREEVIALLTEDLPPRLGAAWATLSLAPAPDVPGRTDTAPAWNAQLIVGGTALGRYWLGPRRSGPSYDADELAQLQALIQEAALALAYADAFDALTALNRELEERVAGRTAQVLEQQRALAVFEERRRLARDLHDSVTQTLFSISLSARAVRGLVRRDADAAIARLHEQEAAAQQALAEMRALLAQLRGTGESPAEAEPGLSANGNLAVALADHCATLERQVGLAVALDVPSSLPPLPARLSREVLHVAREALHNVVKHSGATGATCTLTADGGELLLTVADRGSGFDPDAVAVPATGGFGLRGMQERVAALGGILTVEAGPGAGTTVRIRVPSGEGEERRSHFWEAAQGSRQDDRDRDRGRPRDCAARVAPDHRG